ncbi:serine repeat antigen 9 [Plasmodium gaboni]|uniref:Serine repeat antigen 9 n=2 Tax=Plasmodium gaboni TaxID=647221 RepID=A0A151LLC8_9APIC|nr:serine repeat antigen 9 [Plasmodium gaboni]KYO00011.1 serine repeat antigen 9 [Plasmodium gaboni]
MKVSFTLFFIIYIILNCDVLKCKAQSADSNTSQISTSGQGSSGSDSTDSSKGLSSVGTSVSSTVVSAGSGTGSPSVSSTVVSGVTETGSTGNVNGASPDVSVTKQNAEEKSTTSDSSDNSIKIKSAFLKENVGVKINGPCDEGFGLVLVPHIIINVDTKNTDIQLGKKTEDINYEIKLRKKGNNEDEEKVGVNLLKNVCEKGKNFKFVVYIKGDELIIKWKVINGADIPVDVKKFKIKTMTPPITSIQVFSSMSNENSFLLENKNYAITNNMPDKCEAIATDCFLSGNVDIEKCYQCSLLVENDSKSDVCFNFISRENKEKLNEELLKVQASSEYEEGVESELNEAIDSLIPSFYKKDAENGENVLISFEDLNSTLEDEIINFCSLLKLVDLSGTFMNHQIGTTVDAFNNIVKLLKEHEEEDEFVLRTKLRNPALCMKNVDDWVKSRCGLLTSDDSYVVMKKNGDINGENENNESNEEDYDGVIDLSTNEDGNVNANQFNDDIYCNDDYCNRWKDENSCISNIAVEDQGNCASSWAFSSKLHFETLRCMKGYDHLGISALYLTNCSKGKVSKRCTAGGNPSEFLQIASNSGFLPTESDYPYFYALVENTCPRDFNKWVNLWEEVKLLDYNNEANSIGNKGYSVYKSEMFKDNMDEYIKIIKREIKNKGSVIAYINAQSVLTYDFNGKNVLNMCGSKTTDHSVNVIGYGNYKNKEGEEKSYWLVRNSWGYYWGDEGNFKVDMYGPSNCDYHFINTVVVFNIDIPMMNNNLNNKKGLYNYFPKYTPEFYHNLYDQNFSSDNKISLLNNNDSNKNDVNNSYIVHGQSGEGGAPNTQLRASANQDSTPETVASSSVGSTQEQNTSTSVKKMDVFQVLKHIKNSKIKVGLMKYDNDGEIGAHHSCTRAHSFDPEKKDECVEFCKKNWEQCKDKPSPGFCLTKLDETKGCFFCYV